MQTVDAVSITATAATGHTTTIEAATKMAAVESACSEGATAAASKRAGRKRGTTESKGDCKNNHSLTQHHGDLLCACILHPTRFQGRRSVGCAQRSFRSMASSKIYERTSRFASPILPLLAQNCVISHPLLRLFDRRGRPVFNPMRAVHAFVDGLDLGKQAEKAAQ
jgi:hypothetical protein